MALRNPPSNPSPAAASSLSAGQPSQKLPPQLLQRRPSLLSQRDSPLSLVVASRQPEASIQQQQHAFQQQLNLQQQQQQQQQQALQEKQDHQQLQGQLFYNGAASRDWIDDSISPKSEPKEFCLVAEAARRAEVAVLVRDMAEVAL